MSCREIVSAPEAWLSFSAEASPKLPSLVMYFLRLYVRFFLVSSGVWACDMEIWRLWEGSCCLVAPIFLPWVWLSSRNIYFYSDPSGTLTGSWFIFARFIKGFWRLWPSIAASSQNDMEREWTAAVISCSLDKTVEEFELLRSLIGTFLLYNCSTLPLTFETFLSIYCFLLPN